MIALADRKESLTSPTNMSLTPELQFENSMAQMQKGNRSSLHCFLFRDATILLTKSRTREVCLIGLKHLPVAVADVVKVLVVWKRWMKNEGIEEDKDGVGHETEEVTPQSHHRRTLIVMSQDSETAEVPVIGEEEDLANDENEVAGKILTGTLWSMVDLGRLPKNSTLRWMITGEVMEMMPHQRTQPSQPRLLLETTLI